MRPRSTTGFILVSAAVLAFSTMPCISAQESLEAFGSQQELKEYLDQLPPEPIGDGGGDCAAGGCLEEIVTTASRAVPSITNSQHAGVDEGGIVKQHGDHLVVLRRGRLFTIDVSGPRLKPIASLNAFPSGANGDDTWYDEMLVSNDKIVVIGYSYEGGGTEIGLFDISVSGRLHHRATYHFRSYDYYSSRNYASRLIGDKLILYAPLTLATSSDDPLDVLPAIRKWRKESDEDAFQSKDDGFRPIVNARRIFRAPESGPPTRNSVLHAMIVCNLASRELACDATGVIGEWGRVFYVSPKAMYVWSEASDSSHVVFRMPVSKGEPSAIRVSGSPIDQFSFDETADGYLNVLVRSEADGDAMWASERAAGSVALLRLPIRSFGNGSQSAPRSAYRALPEVNDDGAFHNRFAGEFLLYGTGNGWWKEAAEKDPKLVAVHVKTGRITELHLPHSVDRLETLGPNAVVIGENEDDLLFTGIELNARKGPELAQRFVLKSATQGETRSHGFFYSEDGRGGGILALPVRRPADPVYEQLFSESAGVLYLRDKGREFKELGQLLARDESVQDDLCESSCVDWYGNSRPIFIDGRIFALLGYELVEGRPGRNGIYELGRVNFAPRVQVTRAN